MKVYRGPGAGEKYTGQLVDQFHVNPVPWVEEYGQLFDATKAKDSARHTHMYIVFSEEDVERLYHGLVEGRKKELRVARRKSSKKKSQKLRQNGRPREQVERAMVAKQPQV